MAHNALMKDKLRQQLASDEDPWATYRRIKKVGLRYVLPPCFPRFFFFFLANNYKSPIC
jgi:hypothetical protein